MSNFRFPKKYKIAVYDENGNFRETIERFIYRLRNGKSYCVNYKNMKLQVYGDSEHPNGLYVNMVYLNEELRKTIHRNHVFNEKDIMGIS